MTNTASGRSLDPHFNEARAGFDAINAALKARGLSFMLSGFKHVPDPGYPTFTITMTSRQAELIAEALALPTIVVGIEGAVDITNYDGEIVYVDYVEAANSSDYATNKIEEVRASNLPEAVKAATTEALER